MGAISTGTRLERLTRLRQRIDHEIAAEELRTATDGGRHHAVLTSTEKVLARLEDYTAEQIIAAVRVTALDVKQWGVDQGLIPEIRRGRLSHELAVAYAEHHTTSTTTEGNRPA